MTTSVETKGHGRPVPLLELSGVEVSYPGGVRAVAGVDLAVVRGETLSVVGESGCGKSSLARAIVHAPPPTSGTVRFDGRDLEALSPSELRALRPRLQMIFQDPISSLNPRRTARQIVADGPDIWKRELADGGGVDDTLRKVGIDPDRMGDRRPHQFSGGQCQRISIARAVVLEPDVLVCDEPVSALDVSVQAQVLNLLRRLKADLDLTMVFIAHDLAVVKNISDRVAVMYLGKICEIGPVRAIYGNPAHHYTRALLASVPDVADAQRSVSDAPVSGEVPSPSSPPSGCRFRTRCPRAELRCATEEPELNALGAGHDDHLVACHFPVRG
ncbi:MAG: ATP-binding cassette domain-containing protein [Planctomycetes bacterium]|nr:ATP-binding cassette domain-containing protein [Planctomycetota bacterium]